MGEMSNPEGDAIAWANSHADHVARDAERRSKADYERLEKRVEHLEQTLKLVFEAVKKRMDMDTYAFDSWRKEFSGRLAALERRGS